MKLLEDRIAIGRRKMDPKTLIIDLDRKERENRQNYELPIISPRLQVNEPPADQNVVQNRQQKGTKNTNLRQISDSKRKLDSTIIFGKSKAKGVSEFIGTVNYDETLEFGATTHEPLFPHIEDNSKMRTSLLKSKFGKKRLLTRQNRRNESKVQAASVKPQQQKQENDISSFYVPPQANSFQMKDLKSVKQLVELSNRQYHRHSFKRSPEEILMRLNDTRRIFTFTNQPPTRMPERMEIDIC